MANHACVRHTHGRAYWSGKIQISLVSFGVKLFVATEAAGDIHFHQIDRRTGKRIRHQNVASTTIERDPDEAADHLIFDLDPDAELPWLIVAAAAEVRQRLKI